MLSFNGEYDSRIVKLGESSKLCGNDDVIVENEKLLIDHLILGLSMGF